MQNDKQIKEKDPEKEAKKTMDSYFEVLKHKLGRSPSVSEIIEFASEIQKQQMQQNPVLPANPKEVSKDPSLEKADDEQEMEQPNQDVQVPSILHMKVYYGMDKDDQGASKPNEDKILYYETIDGRVFDVDSQDWLEPRPSIVDHLPNRLLKNNETDVFNAIVSGVIDDDDFESLNNVGMITDNIGRLWDKTKQLRSYYDELDKIEQEDMDVLAKSDESGYESNDDYFDNSDFGDESIEYDSENLENNDVNQDENSYNDIQTEDVLSELLSQAFASAELTSKQEIRIREIVREELELNKKSSGSFFKKMLS